MNTAKHSKSDEPKTVDIAIIGGGIVGATLASLLSGSPLTNVLSVALIDLHEPNTTPDLNSFDDRVVALSPESQAILTRANAWHEITAMRACAYQSMSVWDADGTGHIEFDARSNHKPYLGHICENRVVVAGLNKALSNATNVQQIRGVTLASATAEDTEYNKGYHLTLSDESSVHCSLLLAADGANSGVRRSIGIDTSEWDYEHNAIVATIRTERPHQFCAWQRFSVDGPLAFLPLSANAQDDRSVSIVWSLRPEKVSELMAMPRTDFCEALAAGLENTLGKVELLGELTSIPLRQRHALTYIKQGAALLGDAAHTIHPLAGQGVNLGLYDAQAMVDELERAVKREIPLQDGSILRRYERQRQPANLMAMAAMEAFKRGFGSDNIGVRWARNVGLNTVNAHPLLKQVFSRVAAGGAAHGR